nr:MAG TPA_asm: hypothetical protein [Caudoviricetes sp.]
MILNRRLHSSLHAAHDCLCKACCGCSIIFCSRFCRTGCSRKSNRFFAFELDGIHVIIQFIFYFEPANRFLTI